MNDGVRAQLSRPVIIAAAVELLNEVGLPGLSTRALANRLGVRSPTLYWHVRNKEELLDLVAEAICADAFSIDTSLGWRDQLAQGLEQFRALLLRHRDAVTLLRGRPPVGPNRLGHIETTVQILLAAGFVDSEAAGISRLLTAHVLASVENEPQTFVRSGDVPPLDAYPSVAQIAPALRELSGETLFTLGSEVILDGLEARLTRQCVPDTPRKGVRE